MTFLRDQERDRRATCPSAVVFFTALLATITPFLHTGCGPKKLSVSEILKKSAQAAKNVTSYDALTRFETQSSSEPVSRLEIRTEKDVESKNAHVTWRQSGSTTDGYVVGDTVYLHNEQVGWRQAPASTVLKGGNIALDPTDTTAITKFGEDAKITDESGSSYTIVFDMKDDYISANEEGIRDLVTSELGRYGQMTPERVEAIIDAYRKAPTTCEYVVEKRTFLPESLGLDIGPIEIPGATPMKFISQTTMIDYDQPVDIEIPPEARDAPPLYPDESP